MRFLRKNTAVIITVGPFVDRSDGVTLETALTITNERITLTADTDDGSAPTNILDNVTGATSGTSNDLNYITGNDAGMMQLELSAANTNRNGRMLLSITDAANHVPVFHEFMVLSEMIYDALIGGSDRLDVNVTHIADTAQTARDVGASVLLSSGTGAGQLDFTSGVVKSNLTQVAGTNVTASGGIPEVKVNNIAANAITAASINASALNGKGDWNIGKTGYALSSAGIQAIWDALTSALTTVGSIGKLLVDNINATISSRSTVDGVWGALTVDHQDADTFGRYVGTTLPAAIDSLPSEGDLSNALENAAPTAVMSAIAGVQSDTDNIQTRLPATLTADGNMKADALRLGGTLQTGRDIGASVLVGDKTGFSLSSAGVQAIWDALTSALTTANSIGKWILDKLDVVLSTRLATSSYTAPLDAAGTRSAVGLGSANLDTQLGDIPTNSELTTALNVLNDVSTTEVQTAATAALNAYDPPTRAELTSDKAEIVAEVNNNETKIDVVDTVVDAIKLKTDSLTFAVTGEVDANVKSVADTEVAGTGTELDPWGPA